MNKSIRKAVRTYLIENNKIVVIKYKGKNDGYYDIPGGKIEDYENSEQASIREFKEETGIDITKQHYIGKSIIEFPERIFDFDIYIVDEYHGEPIETHDNISMWIDLSKIKDEYKTFASVKVIGYLKNNMNLRLYCDANNNVIEVEDCNKRRQKMDKCLKEALRLERQRQEENIELIASENYVSKDILELQGSILTNKYAEGYPGKRYYGGCEYIDIFETKAIEYAKKLFGCTYANVQPHSGSSANMAVYRALLNHGDKVMGMNLSNGGHLTHGYKLNFSGTDYEIVSYDVDVNTEMLNYEKLRELAIKEKPKMIIAGASAYSRIIDFKKMREICDEVGAYLFVDMAHIAGLVAAQLHPSPVPYADVVTSTTHKTLRGPRGGLILTNNEEIAKKIDKVIFPGIQGGPLMHVIGAKAECFYEAMQPEFIEYQKQVLKNISAMCSEFIKLGYKVVSGGTDNHLILLDVKNSANITGKEAEILLDKIHITVNKNTIPNETEKATIASGIRIGSPAMTTRGFKEEDFKEVAIIIDKAFKNRNNQEVLTELTKEVIALTSRYPLWY